MSEWTSKNQHDSEIYTEGYNDGYDACVIDRSKYKWHDLRKNPDDLPNISKRFGTSKQIMFVDNEGEPYIGYLSAQIGISGRIYKRWYSDFCDDKIKNVIAWREIEPFEDGE